MNTSIPTIDKVEAWAVPVWTFPAPLAPRLCGSHSAASAALQLLRRVVRAPVMLVGRGARPRGVQ